MEGWFDDNYSLHNWLESTDGSRPPPSAFSSVEVPLVLGWEVLRRDGTAGGKWSSECTVDAARSICKSKHSECSPGPKGYLCACEVGYDGTPYVTDGCQG
ncbi:hypothetical protein TRIUR3_29199 [Triticum urartu]|uniref:EGF-like domain-containing protein n=1 Tax=Triticum urartu TaxID=4572 RepID=M8ANK3_TRIUA|nr:hypothetical protein TRIUR3_29199 [Triticum urartu]